jgi:hypothetical protein
MIQNYYLYYPPPNPGHLNNNVDSGTCAKTEGEKVKKGETTADVIAAQYLRNHHPLTCTTLQLPHARVYYPPLMYPYSLSESAIPLAHC